MPTTLQRPLESRTPAAPPSLKPDHHIGESRRRFLAGIAAAAGASALKPGIPELRAQPQKPLEPLPTETPPPPGIDAATIEQAQRLLGLTFTKEERELIATTVADYIELYEALRDAELPNGLAPATIFEPAQAPTSAGTMRAGRGVWRDPGGRIPLSTEDIVFAPVARQAGWLRRGEITSVELTEAYLERLDTIGRRLEAVVTLMPEEAMAQARQADREMREGRYRGPLHGVPWGAKDLFDTAGVRTTWGAAPFKDRVPEKDAVVVRRLDDAGAVLAAKLSLGALAYGDIWFGGKTRNPWNVEQGSSGSSAGSAAATAAGLVGFSLGTETWGSIASPSARCGATGLRPTFGRVARTGAMALCWSLDKIGPICRTVEDCAIALEAIHGAHEADPASVESATRLNIRSSVRGMRLGYVPADYDGEGVTEQDRAVLAALRSLGCDLIERSLPSHPYAEVISMLIGVEAAASFDELTRQGLDDQLTWQEPQAWPNLFRSARFIPAVEHLQAQRMRRRFMDAAESIFEGIDVFVAPQRHGAMHALTNMTGQPALTLRSGFRDDGTPTATTLWAGLWDESALLRVGLALERELGVWGRRPPVG